MARLQVNKYFKLSSQFLVRSYVKQAVNRNREVLSSVALKDNVQQHQSGMKSLCVNEIL